MEKLIERLKENKPNISVSTIKTYCSLLKSFFNKHHPKDTELNINWFDKQEELIALLSEKPASTRKTTYAALIAISKDNEQYKKALLDDGKTYQEFIDTQTKTDKQEENWKSFDEIKQIYESAQNVVKPLLNKKSQLDAKEYNQVQDFIILSLTSGYWFSPRRSSDWIYMKIKDVNKTDDNFIEKNKFVFNKYKTAKFYDKQEVEIPKGLKLILNKYIKINPYDYLITDNTGKPLSAPRLTQKLNGIFGNKISTSMLRHIYLTSKLKDAPAIKELQNLAAEMGNSPTQVMEYVKH